MSKLALVVGGASCVWDDLAAVGRTPDLVVCVNDSGTVYPNAFAAWVSLHPVKFPMWERARRAKGLPGGYLKWSQPSDHNARRVDRTLGGWKHGSSSFLAVGVAFEMGATEVVLCGVPMQAEGAHFFSPDKPWDQVDRYTAAWVEAAHKLRGRVYSMSGWTRELLGAPPWVG